MSCLLNTGTWLILALLWVPFFFYCGVIYERIRWNKLIQKGILPKPTKQG